MSIQKLKEALTEKVRYYEVQYQSAASKFVQYGKRTEREIALSAKHKKETFKEVLELLENN
jgi:molecular chaperone GrpE (heat shock protein)